MRRTSLPALLALTAIWVRSTQSRRAALVLTAVFTVVTAVTLSVSALTLSTAQQQAKQFGRYQQASYLSLHVGDLTPGSTARVRAAVARASAGSTVWVGSTTLRPDTYTKFFFYADITSLQYVEDTGLREAYPDRYRLQSGRWPTSPRDVVVSTHLLNLLPDKRAFTVLSGHARLHVVGTITDQYATRSDVILAGPGTWESLSPLPSARQYQPVDGQLQLLWNPPATSGQITAAVSAVLPKPLRDSGASEALAADLSRRTDPVSTNIAAVTRDGLVSPAPLLLIVLLVAVLAVASSRRPNHAAGSTLTAVGIRRSTVTATQALASLLTATIAAALGLTVGWLATAAIRALVLTRVASQPLSPLHLPGRDLLLIAVAGVLTVALGTLLPTRPSSGGRPRQYRWQLLVRAFRWLLAAAAITASTVLGTPAAPYLLMTGVLLLGPDLLHALRALLPRTRPRGLVTGGLMRASVVGQAAAVISIGVCIAVPLLTAAQLASQKASDATYAFSFVPPGQIWVQRASDTGDVSGIAGVLRTISGFPVPVAVRSLDAPTNSDGTAGAQARFSAEPTGGIATLVVPTSDALHRILGDAVTDSAQSTLNRGGVLNFTNVRGPQRFAVYANGGQRQRTTRPLLTEHIDVGREYRDRFSSAILTSTAHTLHLPVSSPVKYFYPDVTPTQIQQAVEATIGAGYDSEFIQYTVPPPSPVLPITAYVFFAGLALGGFAVILLTTTDQTRRLRAYSSRLIAIGLAPSWSRQVLTLQTLLITAAGLVNGTIGGLLALHIVTRNYPVTVVPLLPATLAGTTTLVTAVLTVLVAARNLKADGRTH